MWEEATKHLSSNKSEVESKRYAIETRQRNVEAVLSKVPFLKKSKNKNYILKSTRLNALLTKKTRLFIEYLLFLNS